MSNRDTADRVQHLRPGHQGNINDPVWQPHWGLSNRKWRWMGGKAREGDGQSETSAEEDRETWRNAATAPSLKLLDPPSLLLFPLVSTTSPRIPLADWHVGCISTSRRGTSGCLLPDWWPAVTNLISDLEEHWNKTPLGMAKQITSGFIEL